MQTDSFPRWQIRRADGEMFGHDYQWVDAGDDEEPDWAWCEEDEHWAPTEYVAVRVASIDERRRTFGLAEP